MFHVVYCILLLVICVLAVADQLPRSGKRELICLLSFTCNYVVSVRSGFLFLSSSGCLGWAVLFNCDTPWTFHINILNKLETDTPTEEMLTHRWYCISLPSA